MALSANRRQRLQRACDMVHDRAFNPRKYEVPPLPVAPVIAREQRIKTHKEWLEERFHRSVQKEFERLGMI
jgi:hypothetical protein